MKEREKRAEGSKTGIRARKCLVKRREGVDVNMVISFSPSAPFQDVVALGDIC
jgi:hypothetical protein